jgi:hypothetical protein
MIKTRRMRLLRYVLACTGEVRNTNISVKEPEGRDCLEDSGIDERIILNRILNRAWTGFMWLSIGENWQAFVNTVMEL